MVDHLLNSAYAAHNNAAESFLDREIQALIPSDDRHDHLLPASTTLLIKREVQQQVKFSDINQKLIGLYFAAHASKLSQSFTPKLAVAYKDLKNEIEFIFVSRDPDLESFAASLRSMPWPALPFVDSSSRAALADRFHADQLPCLVIVDRSTGRTITTQGCRIISQFGSRAFPFTDAHIAALLRDRSSAIAGDDEGICRGSHGPHFWIINNANPQPSDPDRDRPCAICRRSSGAGSIYVCRDCSNRLHPECADEMDGFPPLPPGEGPSKYRGGKRGPGSRSSSSCLPDWITRLVDPEMKRTVITTAMAGLVTAAIGACSYFFSKAGHDLGFLF